MAIRKSSTSGVPFGNTANRPANPTVGQTYYNGELGYQEIYTNAGWIPATGGNDFNLNITGTYTTVTFSQSFAGGSYSIVSSSNDSTIDVYAYAADGSLAGYTATKAFTATQRFNKMVVIGGTAGDVLSFSYKTTFATSATTTETTAGPFITSISPSAMPNANDTITITGGNFANNVQVAFTGSGYSSTQAKNIVRSSASSLIVTRPDNLPTSGAPYTITITNPGVSAPIGSSSHISSNSITVGVGPVWNTASTLPTFTTNVAYSTLVSASDSDSGSSVTYSIVSNSLPAGLTFNTLTGAISGTPTVVSSGSITIRATDSGGNFVDRTFTVPNIGSNAPVWVTASGALTVAATSSAYSFQLQATDDSGSAPTYSLVSGSLLPGLSLSSSGLISGTPTNGNGSSPFTVRATDANGSFTDRSFSIGALITATLTSSGTWTAPSGTTQVSELLLVGGGGGGGATAGYSSGTGGGGGGGGGVKLKNNIAVTPNAQYSYIIGAGGTATASSQGGQPGGNTSIFGITAYGGNGGSNSGWDSGVSQNPAGSGGGGSNYTSGSSSGPAINGGVTTSDGQLANVGASAGSPGGGGGGGAGSAGAGQSGGSGYTYSFNSTVYGSGGGGGNGGAGGSGAGNGSSYNAGNPGSGTANRGGGGGGASSNSQVAGGPGGSGVIIVRYVG